jgi:hypothetical protein
MLIAMLQRGYSYRVIDGDLPEDTRVRELHVAGTSVSILVESECFSPVSDGAVPEIVPSVEFRRETRPRAGVLH